MYLHSFCSIIYCKYAYEQVWWMMKGLFWHRFNISYRKSFLRYFPVLMYSISVNRKIVCMILLTNDNIGFWIYSTHKIVHIAFVQCWIWCGSICRRKMIEIWLLQWWNYFFCKLTIFLWDFFLCAVFMELRGTILSCT